MRIQKVLSEWVQLWRFFFFFMLLLFFVVVFYFFFIFFFFFFGGGGRELVDEGREDQNNTNSWPSSALQRNSIEMAQR